MQSTSSSSSAAPPRLNFSYYPLPLHLLSPHHHHHHHRTCKVNSNRRNFHTTILKLTSCSKERDNKEEEHQIKHRDAFNSPFFPDSDDHEFCSSTDIPELQPRISSIDRGDVVERYPPLPPPPVFSRMWWTNLKAALGQRINLEAIACFFWVLFRNNQSAIPHVTVPDVRYIDWAELKSKGFQGVVFDKDNTITVPYTLSLWPPLRSSLELCKSLFGSNIAVFSNSAGLREYDHDGRKAAALEAAIGIKVIRHRVKKPAGTAEEIESHFGCEASRLIMVGDRPFTDIVYGNRNGFFTILTKALNHKEEPWIVRQVRWLEGGFLRYLSTRGQLPIDHRLVPDPAKCIKKAPL